MGRSHREHPNPSQAPRCRHDSGMDRAWHPLILEVLGIHRIQYLREEQLTLTGRDHSSRPVSFQREVWVQGKAKPCLPLSNLPTAGTVYRRSTPPRPQQHRGWLLSGPSGPSEPGEQNGTEMWMGTSCLSLSHAHPLRTPPQDTPSPCYLLQCIPLGASLREC